MWPLLVQAYLFLIVATLFLAVIGWLLHEAAARSVPSSIAVLAGASGAGLVPAAFHLGLSLHPTSDGSRFDDAFPIKRSTSASWLGGDPHDDLTRIDGIGIHTARALNELGITLYRHIASLNHRDDAERLSRHLGFVPDAREIRRWADHARALHAAKYRERL
jgi:predicted flap endonuclease-1-like 5' DNA nuclease